MSVMQRSTQLASRQLSRVAVIDVQAKLIATIPDRDRVLTQCRLLVQGTELLGIPCTVTEQYPQGLGNTVPDLFSAPPAANSKLRFSGAEALGWGPATTASDCRRQAVVCGIEAHVCVLQSAADLLAAGYQVFVPRDAIASFRARDAEVAVDRMRDLGVSVTTVESLLFEWCESAAAAEFKQLSQLVKSARTADPA